MTRSVPFIGQRAPTRRTLTSRCTIGAMACWPGGSAGLWLPFGGAVGDQPGNGQGGVFEVFATPGPAVQGPPLLWFGDGVLDADPLGGLLVPALFPAGGFFGRRVLARFPRRGADLGGEVAGQALAAGIDLGLNIGVTAEQVLDPVSAQRGDIVHPAGPERARPQQPAPAVADGR